MAKNILPAPWRTFAKGVWEKIKLSQDKARFERSWPGTPYVVLERDEIAELRERGFNGQIGQDYFLNLLFEQESGRFIDIGANQPFANSNTYFFERKGWTGYAFDPMKSVIGRWRERPGTTFVNAGISDRSETRTFVEIQPKVGWEHQLSSFREFVREEDMRDFDYLEYPVECGPISQFVPAGEAFEFASIDVEGAEALILTGFDFVNAPPKAIMLENMQQMGGNDAHRRTLVAHGYRIAARLNASDDLFVHESHPIPESFMQAIKRHDRAAKADDAA
ncbi:FkbM family methyltransferase [Erythrobacter sp. JK5]|uniref:FkbM family methyltransferase n=1 Tax=Erythrobacter sp. JK5 TaxID=2829500 RepID=UPI001BA67995|nr:FkbM family methyltransferase [Erythrobacter sp. JK5]QUL37648.1 FkbM family methyltransferase [Erythrobacter sp. JK5]